MCEILGGPEEGGLGGGRVWVRGPRPNASLARTGLVCLGQVTNLLAQSQSEPVGTATGACSCVAVLDVQSAWACARIAFFVSFAQGWSRVSLMTHSWIVEVSREHPHVECRVGRNFKTGLFTPLVLGGLGLRDAARTSPAAFWSS